jgi:hypothetical protein
MVVPLNNTPQTVSPVLDGVYSTPATGVPTFRYYNGETDYQVDNNGPTELMGDQTINWFSAPLIFSTPPSVGLETTEYLENGVQLLRKRVFLSSFERDVARDWLHIIPSSVFSAVGAFKQSENSLNVNILQNLAKLPDIASALPQVREAVDVASAILRRDLRFSTFREIADLVTSTELQRSFQWRPYLDVLRNYIPLMASNLHAFGRTDKRVVGYGSFRFQMQNALGRQEVTLLTRTKIVMDTSHSGLLSAILGADAIGILPKPSNIWDLIPFTFAVNWFTGIGSALRRAEYSLLMSTIPAYFVHTYAISSPLSSDELDILKASSGSHSSPSLRLYYRDLSLVSPAIKDSKFGFGMPSGIPSLGTFGSLLYQLIFSR